MCRPLVVLPEITVFPAGIVPLSAVRLRLDSAGVISVVWMIVPTSAVKLYALSALVIVVVGTPEIVPLSAVS